MRLLIPWWWYGWIHISHRNVFHVKSLIHSFLSFFKSPPEMSTIQFPPPTQKKKPQKKGKFRVQHFIREFLTLILFEMPGKEIIIGAAGAFFLYFSFVSFFFEPNRSRRRRVPQNPNSTPLLSPLVSSLNKKKKERNELFRTHERQRKMLCVCVRVKTRGFGWLAWPGVDINPGQLQPNKER